MTIPFETARIALAVIGTAIAAYQDARTSFIDERLTYFMISCGVLAILASLDPTSIAYALGGGAVVFGLGYLFYKSGQLGGGDVLLFTAITLLIPFRPELITPLYAPAGFFPLISLIPFVVSVLMATGFFSLLLSALFYANAISRLKPNPDLLVAGPMAFVSILFILLMAVEGASPLRLLFFALAFVPAVFLVAFKKQILDEVVVKMIPIRAILDEDILVTDKMPKKIVDKYQLGRVLTKPEVEKLKMIQRKEGIALFPIAKELPRLGPYILLALVTTLLVGDLFVVFLTPPFF